MSRADIERFVADLKSDPALLEQIKSGSTGLASVVDMAKAKGYDISIDEAKAYIDEQAHAELSDEQLDAVAGGKGGGGMGVSVAAAAVEAAMAVTTAVQTAEVVTTVAGAADAAAAVEVVAVAAIVAT